MILTENIMRKSVDSSKKFVCKAPKFSVNCGLHPVHAYYVHHILRHTRAVAVLVLVWCTTTSNYYD